MISRISEVKRGQDTQAVHVWGSESEACAVACELEGAPVFRLDSGGFCAEWGAIVQTQVESGRYRVAHELLSWQVVGWRERGRALFKDIIVDREEDEYSRDPSWGTDEVSDGFEQGLAQAESQCAQRLQLARQDEVLVMCTWRVFDRQRGILSARYGLGDPDGDAEVQAVLSSLRTTDAEKRRFKELWVASQAWW